MDPAQPTEQPPTSHEAWFAKLWDEIQLIRSKVDEVLDAHPILKASVDRIEAAVAATHPAIAAVAEAVNALTKQDAAPPPPPTGA